MAAGPRPGLGPLLSALGLSWRAGLPSPGPWPRQHEAGSVWGRSELSRRGGARVLLLMWVEARDVAQPPCAQDGTPRGTAAGTGVDGG